MRISFYNIVRCWICALLVSGLLVARGVAAEEKKAPAPAPDAKATTPTAAPAAKKEESKPPPPPKPKYGPDNPRQVRISARILEWTHKSTLDWGFSVMYEPTEGNLSEIVRAADATFPKQSPLNEGLTLFLDNIERNGGAGGFEVVIDTLEQYGSVEIVTEPNVVIQCINDLPKDEKGNVDPKAVKALQSYVKTTSQVPFDQAQPVSGIMAEITSWKDTAIQLEVSNVEIIEPNYIKMSINSSVTALSGFVTVAIDTKGTPSRRPAVNTRSLVNTVLVRDRSFFISGVLKTTKKFESSQGVPILARIPILKYFMRNEHVSEDVQELLFMVRPEILVN